MKSKIFVVLGLILVLFLVVSPVLANSVNSGKGVNKCPDNPGENHFCAQAPKQQQKSGEYSNPSCNALPAFRKLEEKGWVLSHLENCVEETQTPGPAPTMPPTTEPTAEPTQQPTQKPDLPEEEVALPEQQACEDGECCVEVEILIDDENDLDGWVWDELEQLEEAGITCGCFHIKILVSGAGDYLWAIKAHEQLQKAGYNCCD